MSSLPVALSTDLVPKQVMRASVNAVDLAVWRSEGGVVSAWENRCPHRGMRLSHGFVRGESLACAYHGWHFETSGRCHYMPAHPELELPRTITPKTYDALESDGLIWVSVEGPATAVSLGDGLTPLRSLACDTGIASLQTALDKTTVTSPLQDINTLSEEPLIYTAVLKDTPHELVLAVQSHSPIKTLVHLLIADGADTNTRLSVSRWCETLRREVETL